MKKSHVLCVALLCVLGVSALAFGQGLQRYLVTTRGPLRAEVEAAGGQMIHEFHIVRGMAVELPAPAAAQLARHQNVVSIEPDPVVQAVVRSEGKPGGGTVVQPAQVLEWNVDKIDAELAWTVSTGAGVKVAIVDTGIDKDHPDLVSNIAGGVNYVLSRRRVDPNAWDDDNGHGTHVAGIVAAVNNTIGVVGVAPGAKLYAVKVLNKSGSGYLSDVIAGIQWSVDNNMQVVNMSLGASSGSSLLEQACQTAANAGILLVAAAGNDGGPVIYPAAYSSVIAVGATDSSNSVPSWSNRGPQVEVVAPGVSVRSTWPGGTYRVLSGTSMATPHVTGVCALMLSLSPPPADPRAVLNTTADDLLTAGRDNVSGYGLVDAEEAATGVETGL